MRLVALSLVAACSGAPQRAYLAPVASASSTAVVSAEAGVELTRRYDSIDAFCAPIALEEATASNEACEHEHGSCGADLVKTVAPLRASIVTWTHGSSVDRHEDVAIETSRGVFFVGLDLMVRTCDPEEAGPPNGSVSLAIEHGGLVATWDTFQRSVHVGPDSPPSKKQTCSVRCVPSAVPRCEKPRCGDWSDAD